MANKLAAYHGSNEAMYIANETRSNEPKWKKCGTSSDNFHVLSWNPGHGEVEPKTCQHCETENTCRCSTSTLLAFGCKCGGS